MPKQIDTKLRLAQYNPWVITKTLKVSDTGHEIRLPTKETKEEIIERWGNKFENRGSVTVKLYDWDIKKTYDVTVSKYRRGGYFLSLGWLLLSFERQLKEGDRVGFYWDNISQTLNFKVLQKHFS